MGRTAEKGKTGKTVISASRRTDIPAFYLDWFMQGVDRGYFVVKNPYNQRESVVEVAPDKVHTIVVWSKNFRPFLESHAGESLIKMGFHLFFHFTINSTSRLLEPGIPPLDDRLDQLGELAARFGPESVTWRFDPICFYTRDGGRRENNLDGFPGIARHAGSLGISRCVTSFFDPYPKIRQRLDRQGYRDLIFQEPSLEKKREVLTRMAGLLAPRRISLFTCSEHRVVSGLPGGSPVRERGCISGPFLKALFGGTPDTRKAVGQRSSRGCLCTRSRDIGSYEDHPCYHDCLFCYAAPAMDRKK